MSKLMIETKYGKAYNDSIEDFLEGAEGKKLKGKVNLIFTSPPYPLVSPKKYGNKQGEEYLKWIADISVGLADSNTISGFFSFSNSFRRVGFSIKPLATPISSSVNKASQTLLRASENHYAFHF